MLAIVDYNTGNLRSVENALHRLGAEYTLSADPAVLQRADRVLLPGVGNAAEAMAHLRERQLVDVLRAVRRPVLGICVGMQVLCRSSQEGEAQCMGVFDAHVRRFPQQADLKVPHMGWSALGNMESKLFAGIPGGTHAYFVHSYYAPLCPDTIATAHHGAMFSAALKYENFYGTQFHPEKSGDAGEAVLNNFLQL